MRIQKKTAILLSAGGVIGLSALIGAYVYGVEQGRLMLAQNSRSSIVEALDASDAKTEVDEVVGDIDEAAKLQEEAAIAEAKAAEEAQKVVEATPVAGDPKPAPAPETKKVMTGVTLTNPLVSVEAEAVVFSANLPESLVGSCKVFLQRAGDKAGAWHYNKSAEARDKCVTTISRAQLAAGTWNYEMTFMSDSVYGQNNPKGSFELL